MIDIDGFKEYLYEEELAPNTIATYVKGVEKYAERLQAANCKSPNNCLTHLLQV